MKMEISILRLCIFIIFIVKTGHSNNNSNTTNETVLESEPETTISAVEITTLSSTVTSHNRPFCLSNDALDAVLLNLGDLKKCRNCNCDVLRKSCDIDCCCDAECSETDLLAFVLCTDAFSSTSERQSIYKSLFKDNSGIKSEKVEDCQSLDTKCELRSSVFEIFGNPPSESHSIVNNVFTRWKAGQAIIALSSDETYFVLGISQSLHGLCTKTGPFLYLMDSTYGCQIILESKETCITNAYLNSRTYYEGYKIIQASKSSVPITPYICSEFFHNCTQEDEVPSTVYEEATQVCKNVVKDIEFEFIHKGIHGIIRAKANLILQDFKFQTFTQHVHTTYKWNNEKPALNSKKRGYVFGDPIRAVISNSSETEYLKYPSTEVENLCHENSRVIFGQNIVLNCNIEIPMAKITEICDGLRNRTEMLKRMSVTKIARMWNSNSSETDEWAPIQYHTKQYRGDTVLGAVTCSGVAHTINLVLSYQPSGHKSNPQYQIIGAHVMSVNTDYVFLCFGRVCENKKHFVKFSVTFVEKKKK